MTEEEAFAFREALRAAQGWYDSIFLALGENMREEIQLREAAGLITMSGGPGGIPQSKEADNQTKEDEGK